MATHPQHNCSNKQDLDLRGFARYAESVDWVRRHVILSRDTKGPVLQIDVLLPGGPVSLFADPATTYLMGFRGANGIYLLKDDNSGPFARALEAELPGEPIEVLSALAAHHRANGGLATFSAKDPAKGRIFNLKNLDNASRLSKYPSQGEGEFELVRSSLSLLVCMLFESARIPMMELEFTYRFYRGMPVSPSDAVHSYQHARDLMILALAFFPEDERHLAVERLEKRASELSELQERIASRLERKADSSLLDDILVGRLSSDPRTVELVQRFQYMCRELKIDARSAQAQISPSKMVLRIVNSCKDRGAVRAAKQGVAIPSIS